MNISADQSVKNNELEHASEVEALYTSRLQERQIRHDSVVAWDRRIADFRLGLFVLFLILCALVFWTRSLGGFWLLVPVLGFIGLLGWHERVRNAIGRSAKALAFYDRGLRNLRGTWPGTGPTGNQFLQEDHPFAADLDLFGTGSLYERISTAKTVSGEETLSSWFLESADPASIRSRQAAVVELRPLLDLREDLEILGLDVQSAIDPKGLIAWGSADKKFGSPSILIVAGVLGTAAVVSLALWAFTAVGPLPFVVVVLLEIAFVWKTKTGRQAVLETVERRANELTVLSRLLSRLEAESFESNLLNDLETQLGSQGESASGRIAQLARLLDGLEARRNQAFAPIAGLLMWSTFYSMAIDRWRLRTGRLIEPWLAAIGQFEALVSLAAYAFENPNDPFPTIEDDSVCFHAQQIAHPLLTTGTPTANDLVLDEACQALLISGSNMSGKSTLLRTIGVNTVLAMAGAPVHAKSLRVSVFSIGATLRVQDSLQQGRSRFFAELTRIRAIVDLSKQPRPLLFLLDEIFHGTNSHDRVAGAGGVVRGLLDRGAIGLVTTHDLALAKFAEELAPRVENMHFEDQFHDGVMTFDYQLKPGIVTHSNALALMRAVGLDI